MYSFDFDRLIFCDTSGYALGFHPYIEKYINIFVNMKQEFSNEHK